MAAPVLANRSVCFVNFVGTDDAGYNAVGAPQPRLSIAAALADLAANYPPATRTSPWVIAIGPGLFTTPAFQLPPWCFIVGSCDGQGQPSTILNISGNISLSAAWVANATQRGGIGSVAIRVDSGAPVLDFTMPVPSAGNPARVLNFANLKTDITSFIFQATGTGDKLEFDGYIQDGILANTIAITGGTAMLNQLQSAATLLLASSATQAITAKLTACQIPAVTVTKAAAAASVTFDAISWPIITAVTLSGGPTLVRSSDANADGYTPAVPASWPAGTDTVQKALDALASGGGGATKQTGTTAIINGQQSYPIVFGVPFGVAPTRFHGWIQMASNAGEIFTVAADMSTVTVNGGTLWLGGIPSASAGNLVWEAY